MRKLTQKQVIENFVKRHGPDRYDYSEVHYVDSTSKVTIGCNSCGFWFDQRPSNHMQGMGCPQCKNIATSERCRKTTDRFIIDSIEIHGDLYDYSLVVYVKSDVKVKIICREHGIFEQNPANHTFGEGCPICVGKGVWTNARFVKEGRLIHGDLYDYSLVKYVNNSTPVKIICKEHGVFEQTSASHLNGKNGCPTCGKIRSAINRSKTQKEIIQEFIAIYGDIYDYSETIYAGCKTKITIRCKECNAYFDKWPSNHLIGQGCPRCFISVSKPEIAWLDSLSIAKEYRQSVVKIERRRFSVDAFDTNTNTIYEFYGDYWHGNPYKYDQDKRNDQCKKTFGELYQKTMARESALITAGYTLITIWESDWNALKKTQKLALIVEKAA